MVSLEDCGPVLTFFAHPDDETLSAGASMAKLARLGTEVHVAIPATGVHSRRNRQTRDSRDEALAKLRDDCERAMGLLGVSAQHLYLGEFDDNEMDNHSLLSVVHWLEEVVDRVKPQLILTHHRFCTNIDHRYCHEAAVVASRPSPGARISLVSGEVPSSTGYLRPAQWEPNLYVDVTEQDVEAKISAMETFQTEARPDPHPRSPEALRAVAKVRGSESGFMFAEAFMIQRVFG